MGRDPDGHSVTNHQNFPTGDVDVPSAGAVLEIANPLPFRGVTYIGQDWADARARQPLAIQLPPPQPVSMSRWVRRRLTLPNGGLGDVAQVLADLPAPMRLALATTSSDPEDLVALAEQTAVFVHDADGDRPVGLAYLREGDTDPRPDIRDHLLFEAVANNPFLPDDYKTVMVLRPGAQGGSEITAEWGRRGEDSHAYEYLRRNSYIPWGHYAANMAEDAIRYRADSLTLEDLTGLRHLYYQRTYRRLGRMLANEIGDDASPLEPARMETLRQQIQAVVEDRKRCPRLDFNATLWGWNFGFDYAPSRYRLHASHQQTHQQYALIPREIDWHQDHDGHPRRLPAYACGDLIGDFIRDYQAFHGVAFFEAYLKAVRRNERLDGRADREASLVVHADPHVMLFVPKAQTSQWELQLVTLEPVGNILEADQEVRQALDRAIWIAIRTLGAMGARMVTTIEYAKRFDAGATGQHLLYSFLPRLPESPGAFSEAQLRWIVGHYPEDFAAACRSQGFSG